MIALDTNFLVYAHRSDNPFHILARAAISRLTQGLLPWGVPVACVHEFLAVVTNPKIFKEPTPPSSRLRSNSSAARNSNGAPVAAYATAFGALAPAQ
jgi:predicted nucleic acid-binding protein